MTKELQQRLARQIAEQTGIEVRCGQQIGILSHENREQFRA